MTSNEMIKKLDELVTTRVNFLNTFDKEDLTEEQRANREKKFYELKGMLLYAQNIGKAWHIEIDEKGKIKIVTWK